MTQFNEFDSELAAEAAYGMTADDYTEMGDVFAEMDADDEFAPEDDIDPAFDYGEMDYDPSDEGDLYGGWHDEYPEFDE